MASDRILGLIVIAAALAYIAGAVALRTGFITDPLGPKVFPILVGSIAGLCGLTMVLRPDPQPEWPDAAGWGRLAIALVVLIGYAYALRPLGFLIPTALAAAIISYQISPRPARAVLTGLGLSVGLYALFRFALGLGLVALPAGWI